MPDIPFAASDYEQLPDMFPGFGRAEISIDGQSLFMRTGGEGPLLLLLHGYPQNHVCWHRIAPALADHFTLIIPDLPGYGYSGIPADADNHMNYSKRAMGQIFSDLMDRLGHEGFAILGHDRGARVAYRMALDHPARVSKLVCLDIIPTYDMWQNMNDVRAVDAYHWPFLTQPAPMPETLIMADPSYYLDHTIASWARSRDLSSFDPRAMEHYRATFANQGRIHAACEDYRAGWFADYDIDRVDREAGRKIACPTLVISGPASKTSDANGQEAIWKNWASDLTCLTVEAGHFVAEEAPEESAAHMLDFLTRRV